MIFVKSIIIILVALIFGSTAALLAPRFHDKPAKDSISFALCSLASLGATIFVLLKWVV